MSDRLVKSFCAAVLVVGAVSAHACGFTGGAGIESMFSLDDPLDIMILAVLVGAVCACLPALRKSSAPQSRASGQAQ